MLGLPDIAPQLHYNNEPDSIDRSHHELPAPLLESSRLEVLAPVDRRYPKRSGNSMTGFAPDAGQRGLTKSMRIDWAAIDNDSFHNEAPLRDVSINPA